MKLFQRYLLINFVPALFLSAAFFITFLLTFQLFRLVSLVINKNLDISVIFELMGHIALSFVPMALPLSGLFASIYCMNKLSEDSEIIAMRSFGVKKSQMAVPFVVVGILLSASLFALNQKFIPHSAWVFRNTLIKLTSEGVLTAIKPGDFYTEIPNVVLFAEEVEEGGSRLIDVFIRLKKDREEQMIMAKSGVIIKQAISDVHTPMIRMHLFDGNIIKTNLSDNKIEKILFKEYDFPITQGGGVPGFITKDSMRSNAELEVVIKEAREEYKKLESENASSRELNDIKLRLSRSLLEYWERFNSPLQIFLLIMLGFCLGIKKGRGKSRNSSAMAIGILIGYYAVYFFGVSFAKKGMVPAYIPVFIPSLILIILVVKFYKDLDWAS
ncbi:MAG: hypothetical protein Fur0010_08900 [Bdellovibrio sp.]